MAVAHVLGDLDEERGRVFRAHLLECPDCRARVGELRAIASDLAGVERDLHREQPQEEPEHALDTKERDQPLAAPPPARPSLWPWAALVVLLLALIALSVYVFVLRGQAEQLRQEVVDRTAATAVLEHGDEVPLTYERVGVSATVRADGRDIALVVDGLDTGTPHRVTLLDSADEARSVPAEVIDGRLFVLVEREPGDKRLRVQDGVGELVAEAELDA